MHAWKSEITKHAPNQQNYKVCSASTLTPAVLHSITAVGGDHRDLWEDAIPEGRCHNIKGDCFGPDR